jgi:hypothetical protein
MGHLLQAARWSVLRFRRCDGGQFRYMTVPRSASPLLSQGIGRRAKVRSVENSSAVGRGVVFEGRRDGGAGFRRFTSQGSQFASAREDFDADSDEEEDDGRVYAAGDDFVVVNFYHLVDIEDARHEVVRHSAFIEVRQTSSLTRALVCLVALPCVLFCGKW